MQKFIYRKYLFITTLIILSSGISYISTLRYLHIEQGPFYQISRFTIRTMYKFGIDLTIPDNEFTKVVTEENKKQVIEEIRKRDSFWKRSIFTGNLIILFITIGSVAALIPYSSSIMGFRFKVFFYGIAVFLVVFILFYQLQLIVYNMLGDTFIHQIIYLPTTILSLTGVEGTAIQIIFNYNFFLYSIIFYFLLKKYYPNLIKKQYLPCPLCLNSVPVKDDWICDSCRKSQGRERYITSICKCHSFLKSYYCPHCDKEFYL